jgi:hypothetical protein
VRLLVGDRLLGPRDAAHHVGADRERLLDQLGGARVAEHAVLREGDHRHVDPAPELLPGGEHRLHADQPRGGVDVGEGLHVQHAVALAVGQGLPDRGEQRLGPVVRLDRPGQVDAPGGVGHAVGGVGPQRGVADQRQGADLVQVQVGVHERLGDQPPVRGNHLRPAGHGQLTGRAERPHPAAGAVHVGEGAAAQPGAGDDEGRGTG